MTSRFVPRPLLLALLALAALAALFTPSRLAQSADPWTSAQAVEAPKLVRELNDPKTAPHVLYVGFPRLFTAGHIKAAEFHGSGGSAEGLAQIKAWAAAKPRDLNLVIYCGCCPIERCPNLRPAFSLLQEMGFTHLRVLVLPDSFDLDWASKGYPFEKGK